MTTAILAGGGEGIASTLRGGARPALRFAIHQRHYEASLVDALCQKFSACQWLVGESFVAAAARAYVHGRPPGQPCIAEYGSTFPAFLARAASDLDLPYLRAFATLEWTVGQATIATELPHATWTELIRLGGERLLDARLPLQPGVSYVRFDWGVDELLRAHLGGAVPDRFVLSRSEVPLEVRGSRGSLQLTRLDAGTFAFRTRLATGETIGSAASDALEADGGFDAGVALRRLLDERLVVRE